jgi:hypothetical protein
MAWNFQTSRNLVIFQLLFVFGSLIAILMLLWIRCICSLSSRCQKKIEQFFGCHNRSGHVLELRAGSGISSSCKLFTASVPFSESCISAMLPGPWLGIKTKEELAFRLQ